MDVTTHSSAYSGQSGTGQPTIPPTPSKKARADSEPYIPIETETPTVSLRALCEAKSAGSTGLEPPMYHPLTRSSKFNLHRQARAISPLLLTGGLPD